MTALSVIIPCYNQMKWLPECLASLKNQTFTDFEVVIVDDGSDPPLFHDAGAIVGSGLDGNILWLPQRTGTATALNKGISIASGEFIAIVHADDMVEPWYLRQMMDAAGDWFCYGDLRLFINGERAATLRCGHWDYERAKKKNLAHAAILFPRAAWVKVGGYPNMPDGREDWAMSLRLAHGGYPGQYVHGEPGYLYRQHGDNRSLQNHTPEWTAYFARQMREMLPEVYG